MSGSTIGGVIGGTIGFFIGGPAGAQAGWMIGSLAGGLIAPDVIEGPRLKDAQGISAMEGMPRPFGYGKFVCGGNVIQSGPLIEKSKKSGKGGPVQKTYHYYRTYAIRICEGPVTGIRRIWRNDRLVYSASGEVTDKVSRKFGSKLTIYLGGETQLPDPNLEALPLANGGNVGNVPAYRGTCYVVIHNDDLTDMRGGIPQYRFEIAATGTTSVVNNGITTADVGTDAGGGSPAGWLTVFRSPASTSGALVKFIASTTLPGLTRGQAFNGTALVFDSGWITSAPAGVNVDAQLSAITNLQTPEYSGTDAVEIQKARARYAGGLVGTSSSAVASFGTRSNSLVFDIISLNGTAAFQNFNMALDALTPSVGLIPRTDYTPLPDFAGGMLLDSGAVGVADFAGSGSTTVITPTTLALSTVVSDLCGRVGVPAASIDATALIDGVTGFLVGRQMQASAAIGTLQQGYFFDMPEFDSKLRGVKRAGAIVATIDPDQRLADDADDDETTRGQAIEFPYKVNLIAPDASANYEPAKQTAQRRTTTNKALTEITIEVPIVFSRDENARVADKAQKILWEEATGRTRIRLPDQYSAIVPSDPVSYLGRRWRVVKREEGDGEIAFEMVRDRVSAYTSTATGTVGVAATAPPDILRGPTIFVPMNLPRLRTADVGPGVYVAGTGLLSGWYGYDLEISYDSGATYQALATFVDESVMGALTAVAVGEPLRVKLYGDGVLNSATAAQLAAQQNGVALGGTELAQFATATLVTPLTYDLTSVTRAALGTAQVAHPIGSSFVLLDNTIRFIPIDAVHIGKTLMFRPVSFGTAPENSPIVPFVFQPAFSGAIVMDNYTDDFGATYTDDAGQPYFKVT